MTLVRTLITTAVATMVAISSSAAFAQSANKASHVDFDDQLIQGQVNKGAVHLIERRDADLGSLVKVRKDYRKEILAGAEVAEPDAAPSAMIAAIPASGLPAPKAEIAPAAAPAPVAKLAPAPAAKPAAIPAAAKPQPKAEAKLVKGSNSKVAKSIGGSRAISRR
ncbi:MAG TPA: hypothetical protein VMV18_12710 [bacterium]|nr:hypothetical protein [bacterium]